jgi:peptidoglycan/LPS O-acetylase OafA/YrhL
MRNRSRIDGRPGQALVLVLALLTLAVGFCLFDGDETATGASFDLCATLAMAMASLTLSLLALGRLGPVSTDPPQAVHDVSLRRLDPPPKSPLLFR